MGDVDDQGGVLITTGVALIIARMGWAGQMAQVRGQGTIGAWDVRCDVVDAGTVGIKIDWQGVSIEIAGVASYYRRQCSDYIWLHYTTNLDLLITFIEILIPGLSIGIPTDPLYASVHSMRSLTMYYVI